MKTPMNFLRLGSVMAALLTLAVLPACEDTSVDTSDLDSYFANNPYVSDPRTGPGSDVFINPTSAAISFVGQNLLFTASGGNPPYSWNVSNDSNGSIVGRGNQCDYRSTRLANNNVIVYDVNGHAAIATITAGSAASLSISPSSATIPTTIGSSVQFTVIGGQSPYNWSVSFPSIATCVNGLYTTTKVVANGSINVVTVTDEAGNSASVTVTHGTTLTISPTSPTISAGGSVAFVAGGGDGNYNWLVANPAIISSAASDSGVNTFIYIARADATNCQNTVLLKDASGAAVSATVIHR